MNLNFAPECRKLLHPQPRGSCLQKLFFGLKMEFQQFLTAKLKEKKIDVGVYLSYLMGILEGSEEEDEKREMVLDILNSLVVRNYRKFRM